MRIDNKGIDEGKRLSNARAISLFGLVMLYFKNIHDDVMQEELRDNFHSSDTLLNVFLSQKRNVRDQRFNFVRFGNIRDNVKMVQALDKVCLGSYKVLTSISRLIDMIGGKITRKWMSSMR